ncbi:formylglycine-generating enzyme family protein [Larkinella soli]|uniref:formylglycine-generating enzyme family protein n=1 Tax=Larkinella soli TaxID=1770527 RepID=UPI000FFB57C3|nr:formylglycine-generating enzyme family protein [Larkinella soli]
MKTLGAICLFCLLSHLSYAQKEPVRQTINFSGLKRNELIKNLERVLTEPRPAEEQLSQRDAQAKRQAEAAIALMEMGAHKQIWPLLRHRADPGLRSYLIRDIGRSQIPVDVIIDQLKIEKDVSIRRALLLTLGGFSTKQLPAQKRKPFVDWLLQVYRSDPDPGIHSAIDWLLRHGRQGYENRKIDWRQGKVLSTIDSSLSGRPSKDRNWYVTAKGHTMAIFRGPIEFVMGSPGNEPGRDKTDLEARHRQRIPRSFAVAAKEVTIQQFQQFFDAHPAIKQRARAAGQRDPTRTGPHMKRKNLDEDCPQVLITWFEAAQYCNWLSQQEGIPKEEWCYPSLEEIKEGMVLPTDYLHRTGYRMPTEAEWEYVCRAGASTSRFYGQSDELLREYAWHTGNSFNERPWPVGQLKPNDFGLFDVYGNVWEWGQDWVKQYRSEPVDTIWVDNEDSPLTVSKDFKRSRKGGSFTYSADYMRSAGRSDGYIPDERRDSVGFRVARTIAEK